MALEREEKKQKKPPHLTTTKKLAIFMVNINLNKNDDHNHKKRQKIKKTSFNDLEELLDWAIDHFQEEAPLSDQIIKEAAMANKEINSENSTFKRVL